MILAYLDTNSGIAGDMLLAALVDAGADRDYIGEQLRSLGLPQVELDFSETEKHCFRALRLDVRHPPEHVHRHLSDIRHMLDHSRLTDREKDLATRLFTRLGQAEARVHGTTLEQVHFHEVGAVDSIVDITGVAVALCNLGIQRIIASPTPTGSGTIRIAHGMVSVPAPATAELLKGVPIRSSAIQAELTTPTGAAILSTLVDGFGPIPDMQISRIGYGAGHMDLNEQANLLRVLIGNGLTQTKDEVLLLETNLDDVTGEQIGFAVERLWEAGALDVYLTPIAMKKNRPATLVSVVCRPDMRALMERCLFEHTGTLGVRAALMQREKVHREIVKLTTPFGPVRVKLAWSRSLADTGGTTPQFSPEYEDCRRLALEHRVGLETVFQAAVDAARAQAELLASETISASGAQAHDHSHHDNSHHDHDHHDHDHHDHDHS